MIQKTELRIGNWFKWSDYASMGYGYAQIIRGVEIEDYMNFKEPIPLTTEILEKAGFMRHAHERYQNLYFLNEFRYDFQNKVLTLLRYCKAEGESEEHACGYPFVTDKIDIQYLHTLQNLYYALKGQELTINL